jgi:hypothetical protein
MTMIEMMQRYVKNYGWLPICFRDGKEIYRGEFKETPAEALEASIIWLEELEGK